MALLPQIGIGSNSNALALCSGGCHYGIWGSISALSLYDLRRRHEDYPRQLCILRMHRSDITLQADKDGTKPCIHPDNSFGSSTMIACDHILLFGPLVAFRTPAVRR